MFKLEKWSSFSFLPTTYILKAWKSISISNWKNLLVINPKKWIWRNFVNFFREKNSFPRFLPPRLPPKRCFLYTFWKKSEMFFQKICKFLTCPFFWKNWANLGLFLFLSFFSNTIFYRKNCRLQWDTNSDFRNRWWARWSPPRPLVHLNHIGRRSNWYSHIWNFLT